MPLLKPSDLPATRRALRLLWLRLRDKRDRLLNACDLPLRRAVVRVVSLALPGACEVVGHWPVSGVEAGPCIQCARPLWHNGSEWEARKFSMGRGVYAEWRCARCRAITVTRGGSPPREWVGCPSSAEAGDAMHQGAAAPGKQAP